MDWFCHFGGVGAMLVWFSSYFLQTPFFLLSYWFCDVSKEEIRHHFCSFTIYHVSWNMLLLPSKRVRSGEPAVFHCTFVDPHSSVLVIASRVKCMPSLLVAHTPSRCPLHSSHPKVTLSWCLFLPCGFWKLIWCCSCRKGCRDDTRSQLCGCQSVLGPHPHLFFFLWSRSFSSE